MAEDWFAQYGAPAGGAPPSAPAGGGGGADPRIPAFIAQWQQTHSPSEGIGPLAAAIAQQFPGVSRYSYDGTPSNNELNIGGEKYKVLGGEGSPAAYWYIPGTDDSPRGGGGGGYGSYGSYGGGYGGMAPNADQYDVGYSDRLGYGGGLEMDPGYQFRLGEGAKALERSAAAKGTLLTGGTLKGLTRYAQDYASGEFQNRYQRLFGEQVNRANQLQGLASLGANAAAGTAAANQPYANTAGDLLTQQGNAAAAGTVGGANALNNAIAQGSQTALQMYYLSRLYGGGGGGTGGGGGGTGAYGGPTYVGNTGPGGPVTRP